MFSFIPFSFFSPLIKGQNELDEILKSYPDWLTDDKPIVIFHSGDALSALDENIIAD